MLTGETTTNEIMKFLRDTVATKEDVKGMATKEDLRDLEGRMNKKFESIESRMYEFQRDLDDIKGHLARIEKSINEDTNTLYKEVEILKRRVAILEKQLKAAH